MVRAGAGKRDWVGPFKITNKTFDVTPANNNSQGEYNIRLYYTAAELVGFDANDIKSMGKSAGASGAGNVLGTSFASLKVNNAYSTDFAYLATFKSGFSGFATEKRYTPGLFSNSKQNPKYCKCPFSTR